MPNYRRIYVSGASYFFTVNLRDRRLRLLAEEIALFCASWADVCNRRPFETVAAVVLPEHTHFIWRLPKEDDEFSTRIRLLKSGFTRRLGESEKSKGRKGERNIRRRRFWERLIRDADDLDAHNAFIYWNPLKHGLVNDPDDWRFSTWRDWKKEYGKPANAPPEGCRPPPLGER